MMGEPKSFASLSSGLLARKGAARPAMRPQGFGQVGAGLDDLGWNDMGFEAPKPAMAPLRDETHDAFGEEVHQPVRNPIAALTPASPVHQQQHEIADRLGAYDPADAVDEEVDETAELYEPEAAPLAAPTPIVRPSPIAPVFSAPVTPVAAAPRRAVRPRAAPGSKAKAAFTLRLDGDRHLKLRLACAISGRSAQQIVTEALDKLIDDMPELSSIAEQAPRKRAAN